ncbi:MAG: aliphatic sulfonate ABC transporter substrate-binding protein [Eubacteriales bacterium]|nr:aliphatic sulfonate ABC transporter substrate-binding protein [Eubacteriales bacterium]
MKLSHLIKSAILGAALLLFTSGCGSSKKELTEIHIGYFNNITHAQALLMKSEGSLENSLGEKLSVTWTSFNAGPAEVEALFSGDIDIGYIGPVPAITANVKSKGDIAVLSGATKAGAVLIRRAGTDISSVADLSGKTIAIPQLGNTQHLCLLQLLSENGLSPTTAGGDVTVSAAANADVANLMERGDIDAALVPEPWGATLLAQGAELVLDYDEIYMNGTYDVAVVVVRTAFQKEHPEIVDAFLKEHEAATARLLEDTESSLTLINQEINTATGKSLDAQILTDAFTRILPDTELNREAMNGFAEISLAQGFISALPDNSLYAR